MQPNWAGFQVATAIELLKIAADEYKNALDGRRIVAAVEYQDARGFIWQAERMIEGIAPALESKDGNALKAVRAGLARLKSAFPTAMPPKNAVKDYGGLLSDVSRIELAAGKLR